MQKILNQLESKKCWKSFIKEQCKRNGVDTAVANNFTVVKIRKFFQHFGGEESYPKQRTKSTCWLENELKAFQWVMLAFSGCVNLPIEKFSEDEWQQLSSIFHNKDESILEYEAVKLINEAQRHNKKWENEETQLLIQIIKENEKTNKWNEVARQLFKLSDRKYFRSGKQCRQRWLNHLDPLKKHGQWDQKEDRVIVEFIVNKGRRWSQIAKDLDNHRTEHMVKNRYKTLLIKLRKTHPSIRSEQELLRKFLQKTDLGKSSEQPAVGVDEEKVEEQMMSDNKNETLQNLYETKNKHLNYEFQQVVTPCPIVYQNFTPTFVSTPHSVPFFMTFDYFEKNQHLFLKNN